MSSNYPAGVIDSDFDDDEEVLKCANCDEITDDLNRKDLCRDCVAEIEEDRKWDHADMVNDARKGN